MIEPEDIMETQQDDYKDIDLALEYALMFEVFDGEAYYGKGFDPETDE